MPSQKCQPGCGCRKHQAATWARAVKCQPGCQCKRHSSSGIFQAGHRADGSVALGSYIDAYGYRVLTGQQEHPLAYGNGEVKEHRKVLYDKIGPGQHCCYLCGKVIEWQSPDQARRICTDHVDGDRLNNDPLNLEPACVKCNWDRQNPRAPLGFALSRGQE